MTLPGGWKDARDRKGRIYWYNKDTRVSTWQKPSGPTDEWVEREERRLAEADGNNQESSDDEDDFVASLSAFVANLEVDDAEVDDVAEVTKLHSKSRRRQLFYFVGLFSVVAYFAALYTGVVSDSNERVKTFFAIFLVACNCNEPARSTLGLLERIRSKTGGATSADENLLQRYHSGS
jgi:hypothetical protein